MIARWSGGLLPYLWVLGGSYVVSFVFSVTILDFPDSEITYRSRQGRSVSEAIGLPSEALDWLVWLNWMSVLVLVTSLFNLRRLVDASKGAAEFLSYDENTADIDSGHFHDVFVSYIPQGVLFFVLSHLLFPGYY